MRGEEEKKEKKKKRRRREKKKSVTTAAEFAGARHVVNRASHGKIEYVLTYTFLFFPVYIATHQATVPRRSLSTMEGWPNGQRERE